MYCKYCGTELPENEVICQVCGKSSEDQPAKKPIWKPIVAVVCILAVVAGIAVAVFMGMNGGANGDISSKQVYTGTDEQVLASLDTVVARAGDAELTNGELQIAYWTMIYDFLTYYSDYVQYFFDLETPLSEQMYDDTTTWEQHFLTLTLDTWQRYQALSGGGNANGFTMSQELEDYFDTLYASMEDYLEEIEMESVEEMITHDFGPGGTYENYVKYMRSYYHGNEYYNYLYEGLEFTEAELEAYYTENETDFVESGYSKDDGKCVTVRHILLQPNDSGDLTSYTDDEWAACKTEAELLYQQWQDGGATEELFDTMARTYSSCSSASSGGLIENILEGQMVENFENWIMADGLEYGDHGLIQTEYGYHLMFFVEGDALWRTVAKANVATQKMNVIIEELEVDYPLTVDYSKIWLGSVDLY